MNFQRIVNQTSKFQPKNKAVKPLSVIKLVYKIDLCLLSLNSCFIREIKRRPIFDLI